MYDRNRDRRRTAILNHNLLTKLYFYTHSPTLPFCFLAGDTRWPPTGTRWTNWLSDPVSQTDRNWRGYPCKCNFIIPMRSSCCQSMWAASAGSHRCIFCEEIPDWRLRQRSTCNIIFIIIIIIIIIIINVYRQHGSLDSLSFSLSLFLSLSVLISHHS